jgi:hypothetical protein
VEEEAEDEDVPSTPPAARHCASGTTAEVLLPATHTTERVDTPPPQVTEHADQSEATNQETPDDGHDGATQLRDSCNGAEAVTLQYDSGNVCLDTDPMQVAVRVCEPMDPHGAVQVL